MQTLKRLFCSHKWKPWTKAVDTGCHIYLAQFRHCEKCNKIQVRFISLWKSGNVGTVQAKTVNDALSA